MVASPEAETIRADAETLDALPNTARGTVIEWVNSNPAGVYTLGLAVGLSQEKLKNLTKSQFGTASWVKVATENAGELVDWMDNEFDLLPLLAVQRGRCYRFCDVLAARGASRLTASRAGAAGLLIEDRVETIVAELGLPHAMRGRFVRKDGRTAPADIAIPTLLIASLPLDVKALILPAPSSRRRSVRLLRW